jgi:hypothetical protein
VYLVIWLVREKGGKEVTGRYKFREKLIKTGRAGKSDGGKEITEKEGRWGLGKLRGLDRANSADRTWKRLCQCQFQDCGDLYRGHKAHFHSIILYWAPC